MPLLGESLLKMNPHRPSFSSSFTRPLAQLEAVLQQAMRAGRPLHFLPPYRAENALWLEKLLGIRAAAVKCGLIPEDATLPPEAVQQLIFLAGVSTADTVTEVSGRGVGMDVVRRNVEALRGRIEIRSKAGQGTTFTIRLPLTLAVIDGQVVRIGQARYIVPINAIVRSLRPTRQQISTVQGRGELILERGL